MTSFDIKVLAALLMVIDHVGLIFFPDRLIFRYLGRLSFPLFAWLLGQGEKHTRDVYAYLLRIVIWGLVSQPIYFLLFHNGQLNILFTLALGLIALSLPKLIGAKYVVWIATAIIAQAVNADYGAYGVFTIILMARFVRSSLVWWAGWEILNLSVLFTRLSASYQGLALLAPVILICWNGKQGRKFKSFYLFYPVHLFLLWLVGLSLKFAPALF